MKSKTKKVVGFCGLFGVAAMTTVAAAMPIPGASAVSIDMGADEIAVRVVLDTPDVSVEGLENDVDTVNPQLDFTVNYSAGVDTVLVKITCTDRDGNTHEKILDSFAPDYTEGSKAESFNLRGMIADDGTEFGYGDYELEVIGTGWEAAEDREVIRFNYSPVVITETGTDTLGNTNIQIEADGKPEGSVVETEITVYDSDGNLVYGPVTVPTNDDGSPAEIKIPFAELGLPSGDYTVLGQGKDESGNNVGDPYAYVIHYTEVTTSTDENGDVYIDVVFPDGASTAVIEVTDEGGNPVLVPVTVDNPTGTSGTIVRVRLPFGTEGGLPNGTYIISIDFYGPSGNLMPEYSAKMRYHYGGHQDIPVPDTGGMTGILNIANQDFLITGVIIFGIVAVSGVTVLMKGKKKTTTRRRK